MYTHQFCYILLSLSGTMKTWHNKLHIESVELFINSSIYFVPNIKFTILTTKSKNSKVE